MRTSSLGFFLLLAVSGLLFLINARTRRTSRDLLTGIRALGLSPARCHIEQSEAFVYTDLSAFACYQGKLRSGRAVQLLLAQRRGPSVLVQGVPTIQTEEHVGILLLPPSSPAETALPLFANAQNGGGAVPTRIAKTTSGSTILNFRCAHNFTEIKARLDGVDDQLASLAAPP